jgi:hypothetical protein
MQQPMGQSMSASHPKPCCAAALTVPPGHYFHQPTRTGYNGAQPSIAQLTQGFGSVDKSNTLPTLNRKPLPLAAVYTRLAL